MTDREAMLQSIRENPLQDIPRLIYADYLEENRRDDLDAATVEFIRISCKPVKGVNRKMPPEAYGWIEANWRRLIPTFMDKLFRPEMWDTLDFIRHGRNISFKLKLSSWQDHGYSIGLTFWKGFVEALSAMSRRPVDAGYHLLLIDQPFCKNQFAELHERLDRHANEGVRMNQAAIDDLFESITIRRR